jgi:gamma-glutamyltranspeptidase/glutathione hydrolase
MLESTVDPAIIEGLRQRGHEVEVKEDLGAFGRGQIIWRLPSGALMGGSEPRTDGQAAGY